MQEMLGGLLDGACQREGDNPLLLSVTTIDPGDTFSCLGEQVFLNPQAELSDLPLKSFYRYSLPDISGSGMFLFQSLANLSSSVSMLSMLLVSFVAAASLKAV